MTPQDIDRLVATLDYDGIVKATAPLTEAEGRRAHFTPFRPVRNLIRSS